MMKTMTTYRRILLLLVAMFTCQMTMAQFEDWESDCKGINSGKSTHTWNIEVVNSGVQLSFDWKVSSETNYDKLTIKLDGTAVVNAVSGEKSGNYLKDIAIGSHVLVATYSKDSSVNSGEDKAWVTNVKLINPDPEVIKAECLAKLSELIAKYDGIKDKIENTQFQTAYAAAVTMVGECSADASSHTVDEVQACLQNLQAAITAAADEIIVLESKAVNRALWSFGNTSLYSIGDGKYQLNKTYHIANFVNISSKTVEEVTIPEVIEYENEKYAVVSFDHKNPSVTYWYASDDARPAVKNINFPKSLRYIGGKQFGYFNRVKEVTIPESVEAIGDNVGSYDNIPQLKKITFLGATPPSVTGIPYCQYFYVYVPKGTRDVYTQAIQWPSNHSQYIIIDDNEQQNLVNKFSLTIGTPGSLKDEILSYIGSLTDVNTLTIYGTLNNTDFNTLRSCSDLVNIDLSNISNNAVPSSVFSGLSFLKSAVLPNSITEIPTYAFSNCYNLTDVTIPEGVTSIRDYAFRSCSSLKAITFPSTLISIGSAVFSSDIRLNEVVIPESVTSIGAYSFNYCTGLKKVVLPQGLTTISGNLFSECTSLSDINMPTALEKIDDGAFDGCVALTSFEAPASLKTIGSSVFGGCENLATLSLNEGLEKIGSSAFYSCKALTQVAMPHTLKTLGSGAFYNCWSLVDADLTSEVTKLEGNTFYECKALKNVTLPSTLLEIGSSAFAYSGIESISLPHRVSKIGSSCFNNCGRLTTIYSHPMIRPTVADDFQTFPNVENTVVYVPALGMNSYVVDETWYQVKAIKPLDELPEDIYVASPAIISMPDLPADYCPNMTLYSELLSKENYCENNSKHSYTAGKVIINKNTNLAVNSMKMAMVSKNDRGESASLLNLGTLSVNDFTAQLMVVNPGNGLTAQWHFFSLPYDALVRDIKVNVPNDSKSKDFALLVYRGGVRATSGTEAEWLRLEESDIIKAGQAFAVKFRDDDFVVDFPAHTSDILPSLTTNGNVTLTVNPFEGRNIYDSGWNFLGNPYPCFFDTRYLSQQVPFLVLEANGYSYTAYNPIDDDYVLNPFEAFFIKYADNTELTFDTNGRQQCKHPSELPVAKSQRRVAAQQNREVWNIAIVEDNEEKADEDDDDYKVVDRARLVFNPMAANGFEAQRDAIKMMAMDASVPQVYTIGSDGLSYAINERRPTDSAIPLAVYAPKNGTYKFKLLAGRHTVSDKSLALYDKATDTTTILSEDEVADLVIEAGTYTNRFFIGFVGTNGIMNLENVEQSNDADDKWYNIAGQQINGPLRGINIHNKKKTVK